MALPFVVLHDSTPSESNGRNLTDLDFRKKQAITVDTPLLH